MEPVILFEDRDLLVLNKPPGLSSESGTAAHPSAERWATAYLKSRNPSRNKVYVRAVHRLDRAAEGILLFAKNKTSLSELMRQFELRTVGKCYQTRIFGIPGVAQGTLKHYLRRDETGRRALVSDTLAPGAQEAVLHYRTLEQGEQSTVLEINLETGRFHQIRAQLAFVGWPILGDVAYGGPPWRENAIQLSAVSLTVTHPRTGEKLTWNIFPAWLNDFIFDS